MAEEKHIILNSHSFKCMAFGALCTLIVIGAAAFTWSLQGDYEIRKLLLAKAECNDKGNVIVQLENGGEYTCFTGRHLQALRHRPKRKG